MPNGLTPYDKKVYKESRKRCRQAYRAAETGKIIPIGRTKRRIAVAVICLASAAIIAAAAYFAIGFFFDEQASDSVYEQSESEILLKAVNKSSPLDSGYVPELKAYGSFEVNTVVYDRLEDMTEDARRQGIELTVTEAYVSYEQQAQLYRQKLTELMNSYDYTEVRAEAEARKLVPMAGESEFQTGMLVRFDISDSVSSAYLERNCVKYGFILRFPQDKESVTSMTADSSVYRYVGKENAVNMRSYNMCLEEYCDYLEIQQSNFKQ